MLRHALLIASTDASLVVAVDTLRRLVPRLESVLVVVTARDHDAAEIARVLAQLPHGCQAKVIVADRRLSATLNELPRDHLPDLVVVAPETDGPHVALLSAALTFAEHHQRPLLVASGAGVASSRHLVALTDDRLTGAAAAAAFAQEALSDVRAVGLLVVGEPRSAASSIGDLARLAGLQVPVEELWADGWSEVLAVVQARRDAGQASLVVLPAALSRALPSTFASWGLSRASQRLSLPIVVLPAPPLLGRPDLAATDGLVVAGNATLGLELEGLVERVLPEPGAEVACRFPSSRHATASVDHAGSLFLDGLESTDVLVSLTLEVAREPVAVRLCPPGPVPFALFDVALLESDLPGAFVQRLASDPTRRWCAVRMRHDFAIARGRQLLADRALVGLPLLDATALLDDGGADDVPDLLDGVRLVRVATRLRLDGVHVSTVAVPSHVGAIDGLEVVLPDDVSDAVELPPPAAALSLDARLDRLTAAPLLGGNALATRLDSRAAREELIRRIDASREVVSLQTYMASDDPVGQGFETALVRAAGRGVHVRILADALYSLHEALGQQNTLLARLAWVPGIEVRTIEPFSGLPTVDGLKRRAHRKLVAIDGAWATVSGRNFAAEYYRGFDEVALGPEADWRELPWLDCAIAIEGPLVTEVVRAFEGEWLLAGGTPRSTIEPVLAAGDSSARLLLHDGARDARILEAALALIRAARFRIVIANAFPLALEIQHALLQARRRGVALRVLSGRVRPRYVSRDAVGETAAFLGGAIRDLGDQLVLARLDPLLAAGADVRLFRLRAVPGWDPRLGDVFPYVHAKVMTVDGTHALVGSANFDVTASYWEGEASLLVEDPAVVRDLDRSLDAILDGSIPLGDQEPADAPRLRFRAWLADHWPNMLG